MLKYNYNDLELSIPTRKIIITSSKDQIFIKEKKYIIIIDMIVYKTYK